MALKHLIESQLSDSFYYWGKHEKNWLESWRDWKNLKRGGAEDSVIAPAAPYASTSIEKKTHDIWQTIFVKKNQGKLYQIDEKYQENGSIDRGRR